MKAGKRLMMTALPVVFLLTGCSGRIKEAVPEYVLTYAENQTADYPTTQGAEYFAELVKEETDGRIEIRIYPDAELGDEDSVVKQLTYGGIDLMRVSLSSLNEYSDLTTVLMMPYLYESADHMWTVLDGEIGEEVMASFEGTGLCALSWYDAGARNFYMKEPAYSAEELAGRQIRVQRSQVMEDLIRLLEAEPVPLDYEDVYDAILRGRVDGAENNWSSYSAMKHYLVAPYFIVDEHMRIPELQLISQNTMDMLSEEDQNIIRDCARRSAEYERKLWTENEEAARSSVLAKGVTEILLDDTELEKLRQTAEPLYETYCADHMDLVERIRDAADSLK